MLYTFLCGTKIAVENNSNSKVELLINYVQKWA